MTENKTLYANLSVTEKEDSEIEITAEIPAAIVAPYRTKALAELGKGVDMPGFRKGNIPEKVLVERLGEVSILEKATEMVLPSVYEQIIKDKKLSVIGRPAITITKLAPNNPVAFTLTTAVVPEVTLPDYKEIAKDVRSAQEKKEVEVTDKELDETIQSILTYYAKQNKEGEKEDVPETLELTDELVKKLGKFDSVADFKTKVKVDIKKEKERKLFEQTRMTIGEKIVENATLTLPRILVESELNKMLAQFKDDITKMGSSFEDYLKKIQKTEEDLRTQWKTDAEKRAKLQLILSEIAKKENITADKEALEREVKHLLTHYKDANEAQVRIYVETMLQNEAVFTMLEGHEKESS